MEKKKKLRKTTLRFTSMILGLLNHEDSAAHPFRNFDTLVLLSTLRVYDGEVGSYFFYLISS